MLFIQGGGDGGYTSDKALAASLQAALGKGYDIRYPRLHTDEALPDFGWLEQIGKELSAVNGEAILVGHSLGASMLLKFLSENRINEKLAGIFLISTPFWRGNEDWKKGLKLHKDFIEKLPNNIPIFLYHCVDDEEVPFDNLGLYRQQLTEATLREIPSGGHQLNNDLSLIAKDLASL